MWPCQRRIARNSPTAPTNSATTTAHQSRMHPKRPMIVSLFVLLSASHSKTVFGGGFLSTSASSSKLVLR